MGRRRALCGVVCGLVAGAFAHSAQGVDVVFVPTANQALNQGGGVLEAQGSSGRIDLPVALGATGLSSLFQYSAVGATANSGNVYTLLNDSSPTDNSILVTDNLGTGTSTAVLGARLDDVAYTNGQLYGIVHSSNQMQIDTIAANGAVQNVLSTASTVDFANWRLSGAVNGNSLLALRADAVSSVKASVINTSTLGVSSFNVNSGGNLTDTVINSAGSAFTTIGAFGQNVVSFPGGVAQGSRASNTQYGKTVANGIVSDEFSYGYLPSLPAVVTTSWNASNSLVGTIDGLTRTPQMDTITGPIVISNYLAPDGTTLSNISATSSISPGFEVGGPTLPTTSSVQNSPAGDLSNRTIGTATATMDLTNASRGIYAVPQSSTITGDYSYGNTVDHGRAVQVTSFSNAQNVVYYDPISSNLVGNGDAALQAAGWEDLVGGNFVSQFAFYNTANKSFALTASSSSPGAIRQILQIPTPNSPMELSFTYDLELFPTSTPADIEVSLNGILMVDLMANSGTVQTFQTLVTNPALENLTDATLMFRATTTNSSGSWVDVGNISLTAVPEPGSAMIVCLAGAALLKRRGRGGFNRRSPEST